MDKVYNVLFGCVDFELEDMVDGFFTSREAALEWCREEINETIEESREAHGPGYSHLVERNEGEGDLVIQVETSTNLDLVWFRVVQSSPRG